MRFRERRCAQRARPRDSGNNPSLIGVSTATTQNSHFSQKRSEQSEAAGWKERNLSLALRFHDKVITRCWEVLLSIHTHGPFIHTDEEEDMTTDERKTNFKHVNELVAEILQLLTDHWSSDHTLQTLDSFHYIIFFTVQKAHGPGFSFLIGQGSPK